jgi:hypothetical protein
MTRDIPDGVRAWLAAPHDAAPAGWESNPPPGDLACSVELIERLALVARPLRTVRRVFVEGCPVIHHPDGPAIACAWNSDAMVVRAGGVAGPLESRVRTSGLSADWIAVDPWADDVLFRRGTESLRDVLRRAYDAVSMRKTG